MSKPNYKPSPPVHPGKAPVNKSVYDGCAKNWTHPAMKDNSSPAMTGQNFRNPKSVTGR